MFEGDGSGAEGAQIASADYRLIDRSRQVQDIPHAMPTPRLAVDMIGLLSRAGPR